MAKNLRTPTIPIFKGSGEATGMNVRSRPVHSADLGKAQRAWNALQSVYNLNGGVYHKTGKRAGARLYGRPSK
jgi:hypothetical protein